MKNKMTAFFSIFMLYFCAVIQNAFAEEGSYNRLMREYREHQGKIAAQKKAENPKSIWDDENASNPYFKKTTNKKKTAVPEDQKKKNVREPKKSTFKRRVYTGPSKDEIAAAAKEKAISNFNAFLSSNEYVFKYDGISYDDSADSLSVKNIVFSPVKKNGEKTQISYLMKADEVVLRNSNIGETSGTPLATDGKMTVRKLEIPVWNENGVKKGKVDIAQLKMTGDLPSYLKAKGSGKLNTLEVKDLRSETIINETILNNIIRSKVFSASAVDMKDVEIQNQIVDALKRQDISGLNFSYAQIDGRQIPTPDGLKASMTSYSARILNTDLVLGARLEAAKEKPEKEPDLELLKKNAAENKAEIKKVAAETLKK